MAMNSLIQRLEQALGLIALSIQGDGEHEPESNINAGRQL
jgi:hypothetical protein